MYLLFYVGYAISLSLYVILLQFCLHVDHFYYYGHVSHVTVIAQNSM